MMMPATVDPDTDESTATEEKAWNSGEMNITTSWQLRKTKFTRFLRDKQTENNRWTLMSEGKAAREICTLLDPRKVRPSHYGEEGAGGNRNTRRKSPRRPALRTRCHIHSVPNRDLNPEPLIAWVTSDYTTERPMMVFSSPPPLYTPQTFAHSLLKIQSLTTGRQLTRPESEAPGVAALLAVQGDQPDVIVLVRGQGRQVELTCVFVNFSLATKSRKVRVHCFPPDLPPSTNWRRVTRDTAWLL